MLKRTAVTALLILTAARPANAIFGMEIGPLLQLVAGQIQELEGLTKQIGIAKDQQQLLETLNAGIGQVVTQITAIESLIDRSQGLDPTEVQSLADLNDLIARTKSMAALGTDVTETRLDLSRQALSKSALQSDTSYKLGQDLVVTGGTLAEESRTASPGRASQITASTNSALMVSKGVELQTLSQMVQLQAMTLELQRAQVEREYALEKARKAQFRSFLGEKPTRRRP